MVGTHHCRVLIIVQRRGMSSLIPQRGAREVQEGTSAGSLQTIFAEFPAERVSMDA